MQKDEKIYVLNKDYFIEIKNIYIIRKLNIKRNSFLWELIRSWE